MSHELATVTAPTIGQLALASLAAATFVYATVANYRSRPPSIKPANPLRDIWPLLLALALNIILIAWRVYLHPDRCIALADNFDTIVFFTTLLAGILAYLVFAGRLSGIRLAVLPILSICQVGGILLAGTSFRVLGSAPMITLHVGSMVLAGGCFALAAAGGALYLWENRQLRALKLSWTARTLPALESLQNLLATSVLIGFCLLTVSFIIGILQAQRHTGGLAAYFNGKVLIGGLLWLGYAALLHHRYWPRLTGTKAAWLAIAGFGCMVLLYVLVVR